MYLRNYRHFLWIGGAILIFDDIRTHEKGKLEWLLHHQDRAERRGSEILLSNGDARAVLQPLFPEAMTVAEKKGLKDHDPDTEVEYIALTPKEKSRETKFITAILPLGQSRMSSTSDIELLEGDEMLGVRLSRNKKITEVFLNLRADGRRMHRNSNKIIHEWDTDAYLFGTTRPVGSPDDPDSISRCFVICGSYLRKNGKVVLDSPSKVYSIFATEDGGLDVALQGQPIINCEIRAKEKPVKTILNDKTVNPPWNESQKTVKYHISPL